MQCGSQCYCDIVISSDSKNKSFQPINIGCFSDFYILEHPENPSRNRKIPEHPENNSHQELLFYSIRMPIHQMPMCNTNEKMLVILGINK